MKLLFENWKKFINENVKNLTFDEIRDLISSDPTQHRVLDMRKNQGTKSFSGVYDPPINVPFDYGEFPDLINAADNMGWDFIIADRSDVDDENLQPVGHVSYNDDQSLWDSNKVKMPTGVGENHKIVLANNGLISVGEKALLNNFFGKMWQFKEPEWY